MEKVSMPTDPLMRLPRDVLRLTLQYLPARTVASLARLSREWCRTIHDEATWRSALVRDYGIEPTHPALAAARARLPSSWQLYRLIATERVREVPLTALGCSSGSWGGYPANAMFEGRVFCSWQVNENVDILADASSPWLFERFHLYSPSGGFTAPVDSFAVWALPDEEAPTIEALRSRFPPGPSSAWPTQPIAARSGMYRDKAVIDLPVPAVARFLFIRLISSGGDRANIDAGPFAAFGRWLSPEPAPGPERPTDDSSDEMDDNAAAFTLPAGTVIGGGDEEELAEYESEGES